VVRHSHANSAWRLFGAVLGAFAIGLQVVLSAWLLVQAAAMGHQADLSQADLEVICTHDSAGTANDGGPPPAPHQHGQCLACATAQWAKLLAPLPAGPSFLVLRPHSQTPRAYARVVASHLTSPSPYASRAPPFSA
jgi:hypothetical protein